MLLVMYVFKILALLPISTTFLFSQKTAAQIISVTYNTKHIIDTIENYDISYQLFLYANTQMSYCASNNVFYNDSILLTDAAKSFSLNNITDFNSYISQVPKPKNIKSSEAYKIYKIYSTHIINEEKIFPIGEHFCIKDTLGNINWKIENNKKKIQNYLCQKATANYKGRNWIAWFSNEIPISEGPWKLNGLPGIILEAYDQKEQIKFTLNTISKIDENKWTRALLSMNCREEITKKDYYKFLKTYADDPTQYYSSRFLSEGLNTKQVFSGRKNNSSLTQKAKIPNNPIEPYQ